MQLALVDSGRQVAARAATERAAVARTDGPARIDDVTSPDTFPRESASAAAPVRRGLKSVDRGLNHQISGAQQAQMFLERAAAQLQDLRTALTGQLSSRRAGGNEADPAPIEQQMRRFSALWHERSGATAGTVDSQIRYVGVGEAQQKFTVRGLQMSALRAGAGETLYVAVAGRSQHAAAVVVDPEMSAQEIAQRFDRALAPSGIRATQDAQGELSFTVPESAWSGVRDALAIKGEGRRFPTGAFNAVRVIPQPPAIQPEEWSAQTQIAARHALGQVANAQQLVRAAHFSAQRALAGVGQRLQSPQNKQRTQTEGAWSAAFAQTFAATGNRSDYQALAALSPALRGMSRDRVVALLADKSS